MIHISIKISKNLNVSSEVQIFQFERTGKTLTMAQKQNAGLLHFWSCSSTHLGALHRLTSPAFLTDRNLLEAHRGFLTCTCSCPSGRVKLCPLRGTHTLQEGLGNISCRALLEENNQQIYKIKSQLQRLSGNKQSQLEMQMSLKGSVSVDSRLWGKLWV